MSREAKYKAVGNGVPVPMARVIAGTIKVRTVTRWTQQLCVCLCGRPVRPGTTLATVACRKANANDGVTRRFGCVTELGHTEAAASQIALLDVEPL
jgi:hypothetical protein